MKSLSRLVISNVSSKHKRPLGVALACTLIVGGVACRQAPTEPAAKAQPVAATPAATPAAAPVDKQAAAASYVAGMVADIAADPKLALVNADEAAYEAIRRDALKPWVDAWRARNGAALANVLAPGAKGPAWSAAATARREKSGIRELDWKPAASADTAAEAGKYVAAFADVADFKLDVYKIVRTDAGATLSARYDLRGTLANGARRHDRGTLELSAALVEKSWRLSGIAPVALERLESAAARTPAFEYATVALGLDKAPVTDRKEAIRRGGYAIASADYDNDGRPDLLLGNYDTMRLYQNTPAGFKDVTAEAGIGTESLVKAASFADLDNDGLKDLVLLRFVISATESVGDFVAYRNLGAGKFERKGDILPRSRNYDRAMPLTLADFDGNGTLDIYLGFPGARDFTENLEASTRPQDLASQGLWMNDGKWAFTEAKSDAAMVLANNVYPHSVVASDIDQDGRPDLLVVDDSGRVNPVYKNIDGGSFKDITKQAGVDAPGWSMGLSTGDYDGDGHLDIVTTNVALLAGERVVASAEGAKIAHEKVEWLRGKYVGAQLYRNKGDGTFEEVAQKAGVNWVGEAAGGAEWLDYDADGQLDMYVPNGLWSGGAEALDSVFMRSLVARGDKYDKDGDIHRSLTTTAKHPNRLLGALRESRTSVEDPSQPLADKPTLSLAGQQRNRLFRNNGDGTFTEVGFFENADRVEDGYVVALADLAGNGRQDVLLRHTDSTPGRPYESVTVLRNVLKTNKTLTVLAQGTKSNRDGIGATVTAWVGGRKLIREIRATNGATQSEPTAFFGLGLASKVDKLEIRWVGGGVQTFEGVAAGRVVLQEEAGLVRLAQR